LVQFDFQNEKFEGVDGLIEESRMVCPLESPAIHGEDDKK